MGRCRPPVNRILLLRKKGLGGSLFQNIGGGVCAKSVGAYYDVNGGGGGADLPVFYAATYDPDTYELMVQLIGEGTPTTIHATPIYAPDYEGVYQLFPANTPVWQGARCVLAGGAGTDVVSAWADDELGLPIDPQPFLATSGFVEEGAITPISYTPTYDAANHDNLEGGYYMEIDYTGDDTDVMELGTSGAFLYIENGVLVLTDGQHSTSLYCSVGTHKIGIAYGDGLMDLNLDGVWASDITDFVSVWQTTTASESLTLPATGTNNFLVDWGDGNVETVTSASPSHTYDDAGTYKVDISGSCPVWNQANGGDKLKLLAVLNLGVVGWTALEAAFHGCSNMKLFVSGNTDTSLVTNMSNMLRNWSSMTTPPDLSGFDTSSVTNMSVMMHSWSSMKTPPDLSGFDTSLVTDMTSMLRNWASMTIPPDLSGFDTSSVTNMTSMMYNWSSTQVPDISNFDVSKVISGNDFMFSSSMSTVNYDKCLAAWANHVSGRSVCTWHFGSSTYTSPSADRTELTTNAPIWTITDGGAA